MPKIEVTDLDLPSENMCSRNIGVNVASSSGSNIRLSLLGMGFSPSLVDKVIEEKGEDNIDLLLETLFEYSALGKPGSESSDSLDGLFSEVKDELAADGHSEMALGKPCSISSDSLDSMFGDDKDTSSSHNFATDLCQKEEPGVRGVNDDKKASLLMMNFSLDEIEFAIEKLGEDAPISELVDFIFAAQIAGSCEKDTDDPNHGDEERKEDSNTEALFGTMDKTLRLLEMGFSENEISTVIEKYGSEVPISMLADSIVDKDKYSSTSFSNCRSHTGKDCRSFGGGFGDGLNNHFFDELAVKTEEYSLDDVSQFRDTHLAEKYKGKRPKEEYVDESTILKRPKEEYFYESSSLKRPKEEYADETSSFHGPRWPDARKGDAQFSSFRRPAPQREVNRKAGRPDAFGLSKLSKPKSCRSIDQMVAKLPYFFYGNVMNLTQECWLKISQFLYAIEPEFVNTRFFSALSRKEGYIHNLPTENRFHILPKPPMTIEEAIPCTKQWWPSWDTRKQLSCISSETNGISQQCDRLGKILVDSKGLPSVEQQKDLLHQCRTLNLLWVGNTKLEPIEPEDLERILGYPLYHTGAAELSLTERLQSLKHCFQTDTLGYHLSVLKSLFPTGLTVLSIYSGIGGAEVTLHRLGIRLKAVVSVEPCERKKKILKRWWHKSDQAGELVQIENIQKLVSNKLDSLISKFGGFDFIICQNPYTYSSKSSKMVMDGDGLTGTGLDFSLFYEFVRVLQRVRSLMDKNK
ncbi:probable inactive DNA (cytosine-5)-methyltransferase DRM3 isoform X2 [Cornus florida]|uniref:probable inactive DNA (cytosine-5)-methyltransferase DRM3 isoform X2 n=1 Tax=Cornus florida TaxID=4283 RepID=UPI00289C9250|nr:probable inactive DNA (cytosine-5)-methyltransferase DRM3 isoform X2 [Cornus florida]